ncbi:MAG: T9SS type A sorting domain-containing protein [Ignavibacteria bacterium]|nr:T9SS type A sorting domain-containing protein [Ignavibacteria bacterium]MBT8381635.1 T9SS type A sorting domain-containing protein [Ignavibacteria bacterium]NNL22681.1 T9SS type A sorting domain-containing protein [Ignavibacteriaceae bacterium]
MHQKIPEISMDTVGDFVIVWLDDRYGQTDHDIIGQRYFSNGNPNGGNYLIVANGPNNGVGSPVVFADNSNIIFSWEDNRRSQGRDIYAKIVNWNWNGATDVDEIDENIPEEFSLSQNYPNPFNPTTKIKFTIPSVTLSGIEGSPTTLKINDVLGNEIITLVNEELSAGEYEIEFDAKGLTSGIYFYQLKAGNYLETEKMILLK